MGLPNDLIAVAQGLLRTSCVNCYYQECNSALRAPFDSCDVLKDLAAGRLRREVGHKGACSALIQKTGAPPLTHKRVEHPDGVRRSGKNRGARVTPRRQQVGLLPCDVGFLRTRRTRARLSQQALSLKAGLGREYIGNLERGVYSEISRNAREKIAKALGCDPMELVR